MRPRFVSPMGSILSGPNKTVQRIVHIAKSYSAVCMITVSNITMIVEDFSRALLKADS